MPFSETSWRESIKAHLAATLKSAKTDPIDSLYGVLAASALWPLVAAFKGGEMPAVYIALGSLAGNLDGMLLANQLQQLDDKENAPQQLAEVVENDSDLRRALDTLLQQLELISLAETVLAEKDKQWFVETMQKELQKMGNSPALQIQLGNISIGGDAKDNVIVTGKHNRVDAARRTTAGINIENLNIQQSTAAPDVSQTEEPTISAPRRTYLLRLQRFCQHLPLAALGGDELGDGEIKLDQVYTELKTLSRRDGGGKNLHGRAVAEEEPPLTAVEAVANFQRMILLGEPGGGKSTFVKKLSGWLAGAALDKEVQPPPGLTAEATPVFLVLRDLTSRLDGIAAQHLRQRALDNALMAAFEEQLQLDMRDLGAETYLEKFYEDLQNGDNLLVLDGLDEVPTRLRPLLQRLAGLLIDEYQFARTIVTCRVRSYDKSAGFSNFTTVQLAPLDQEAIEKFIRAWYRAQHDAGRYGESQATDKSVKLIENLQRLPQKLKQNPMMLTTIAIVDQNNVGLPKERVKLYRQAVEVLLIRWQREKDLEKSLLPPEIRSLLDEESQLMEMLVVLAYQAHQVSRESQESADLDRDEILRILNDDAFLGSYALGEAFLSYVDHRAGILVGRGGSQTKPQVYSFPHRVFQEYLAGCYLIGHGDPQSECWERAKEGEYWSLAIQLGVEDLFYNQPRNMRNRRALLQLAYSMCNHDPRYLHELPRIVLWSANIAEIVPQEWFEKDNLPGENSGTVYLQRLRQQLPELLHSNLLPSERLEAGRHLARLGDPREAITTLHKMEFCYVPGGPFYMGSKEKEAYDNEKPRHLNKSVNAGFWIGRYPLSNSQFSCFVGDGGYNDPQWWVEAKEAGLWSEDGFVGGWYEFDEKDLLKFIHEEVARKQPFDSGEPFMFPNHPVVGISWYEALAYCRWVTLLLREKGLLAEGEEIRLPSEAEWEKAARGGLKIASSSLIRAADQMKAQIPEVQLIKNVSSKRRYPWGEQEPTNEHLNCNYDAGVTSAAGCFPQGKSPCGCEELSGTVWEWTRSKWRGNYNAAADNEIDASGADRVIRGGSWAGNARSCRVSYRGRVDPAFRDYDLGFRLLRTISP